ncbi:LrgB family protein [Bacteroidales bacterium MB20-C3-3]|nr:LrgB family protein [Bacteroidales bacterium MB20-C3-3]
MKTKVFLELGFILITLISYLIGRVVYRRTKWMIFHTVIVATAVVIIICSLCGAGMELYEENTMVLKYLLNISVVAFGYLLHKHFDYIKERGLAIFSATLLGSLAALVSVVVPSLLAGSDTASIITLLPKSVTNPIAIVLSAQHGGDIYLTSVIVIIAGIFGAVTGPWFLKISGIDSPLAKGIALGSASHGIGTAKALEMGALEGAAGGLAIALMGLFTSLLVPLFVKFFLIL